MSALEWARTLLFVPATRMDRLPKAEACGADAIIIDLEDAVPPQDKDRARALLLGHQRLRVPTLVRINADSTQWFADDLDAVKDLGELVDGVLLPKTESAESVQEVVRHLLPGGSVVALVETARGFTHLDEVCRTSGVVRLAFGALDFGLDTGVADDGSMTGVRVEIAVRSKARGLAPPVDGVTTTVDDPETLSRDVRRARAAGFGGKLCIHPRQIEPVQAAFTPEVDEIDWARRVLYAASELSGQPFLLDGEMVDQPVLTKAQQTLARAGHPLS